MRMSVEQILASGGKIMSADDVERNNANCFMAADEIERLRKELDETKRKAAKEYELVSKLIATFERDAMRYHWLRNSKPRHGYASVTAGDLRYTGTCLDELIDQELGLEK